jgi:DNA-binding IclR family transcriptional regulator
MGGAATVEKALDVLFHLHASGAPLGLSEIGRALDLPKSSCHRLLSSLVAREVVDRDAEGRYRPGLALLALGIGAQSREPVVPAARPVLQEEAEELGETVFLVGRRHGQLRVLDKVEGSAFLRAAPGIGDTIPDDVTAAGKLYRLHEPGVLPDLASREARTILDSGFAINRDAWLDGLSVLAVPIWQTAVRETPRMIAVLALAAATPRFDALGSERIAERLLAAAHRIGGRLSGTSERVRSTRETAGLSGSGVRGTTHEGIGSAPAEPSRRVENADGTR